jgi:aryl-alcohol dehydrogenase-like predicted oxidoreductase
LGLGGGPVGDASLGEKEAAALLNGALDLGVRLIDTAPSYGLSEERIGRHLKHRRHEFVLSSKCGYGVPGTQDWTPECIQLGVDRALSRLQTDYLDIMHFHSCPEETLRSSGVVEALQAAVRAGKVRVAAYSGEGDALQWAIKAGSFGAIQRSVNLCDQGQWREAPRELGVLAKRTLMNGAFVNEHERPAAPDVATYWDRLWALKLSPAEGMSWAEYSLRFAAFTPGVSCALAGTRRLDRLKELHGFVEKGPLPEGAVQEARRAYERHGSGWPGLV